MGDFSNANTFEHAMKNFQFLNRVPGVPAALAAMLLPAFTANASNFAWTGQVSGDWNFSAGVLTNWLGTLRPSGGDDLLIFPQTASNKAMVNDFADGTRFHAVEFAGTGYSLTGNRLLLQEVGSTNPSIKVSHGAGTTTISVEVQIMEGSGVTVTVDDAAAKLVVPTITGNGTGTVIVESRTLTLRGDGTLRIIGLRSGNIIAQAPDFASWTVGAVIDSPTLILARGNAGNDGAPRPITVRANATLRALGAVGNLALQGILFTGDPDDPANIAGRLSCGNLTCTSTAEIVHRFAVPGGPSINDNIFVTGTVTAGNAKIRLEPLSPPFTGDFQHRIIQNDGTDPISGTFRTASGITITEGFEMTEEFQRYRFSYVGGDGNDFTVQSIPAPAGGTKEWHAGGSTRNFSEATNWTTNTLPVATDTLVFGSLAPAVPLAERFPIVDIGGNVHKLRFTSGGYSIEQAPGVLINPFATISTTDLELTAGIEASHSSGGVAFEQKLRLAAPQTWSLTGNSSMSFGVNYEVDLRGHELTLHNAGSSDLRINGDILHTRIGGSPGIVKTGSGRVIFGGAGNSTYGGTTRVQQGELRLSRTGGSTAVSSQLEIGGGPSSASVTTTAAEQIRDFQTVTVLPNGSFLPGAEETLTSLIFSGGTVNSGTNLITLTNTDPAIIATVDSALSSPLRVNSHLSNNSIFIRDWQVEESVTFTHSGALSLVQAEPGITQRKTGGGRLVLSGTLPRTTFSVDEGALEVTALQNPGVLAVSLNGGSLSSNVRLLGISATATGGTLAPLGASTLRCSRLALNSAVNVQMNLNSGGISDNITVTAETADPTGTVALGNATLRLIQSVPVAVGTVLTIITNDGTDAVSGTFAGLAQGTRIQSATNTYILSYTGGTGNDVTLTAVFAPEIVVQRDGISRETAFTETLTATPAGSSSVTEWTIRNTGTATLNLVGSPRVQINGADASSFSLSQTPAATVAAGGSTTFRISFQPSTAGTRTAQLAILTDDLDEAIFTLNLTANSIPAPVLSAVSVVPPAAGQPGKFSATVIRAKPSSTITIQASSNLTAWTTIGTATTDANGTVTTGLLNDATHTTRSRRFYRAVSPL
jgi:autotransporter-associated beta strand protein